MKKKILLLLLFVVSFLGLLLVGEYYSFKSTKFSVEKVNFSGFSQSGINITLVTRARNNGYLSTNISSQYIEVYMNENHVATINREKDVVIKGNSERLVKYPVNISFSGTLQSLYEGTISNRVELTLEGSITFSSRWTWVDLKNRFSDKVYFNIE